MLNANREDDEFKVNLVKMRRKIILLLIIKSRISIAFLLDKIIIKQFGKLKYYLEKLSEGVSHMFDFSR